jgi:hypothetical protein
VPEALANKNRRVYIARSPRVPGRRHRVQRRPGLSSSAGRLVGGNANAGRPGDLARSSRSAGGSLPQREVHTRSRRGSPRVGSDRRWPSRDCSGVRREGGLIETQLGELNLKYSVRLRPRPDGWAQDVVGCATPVVPLADVRSLPDALEADGAPGQSRPARGLVGPRPTVRILVNCRVQTPPYLCTNVAHKPAVELNSGAPLTFRYPRVYVSSRFGVGCVHVPALSAPRGGGRLRPRRAREREDLHFTLVHGGARASRVRISARRGGVSPHVLNSGPSASSQKPRAPERGCGDGRVPCAHQPTTVETRT